METKKMYVVEHFYTPYEANVAMIDGHYFEVDGDYDSDLYRLDDHQLFKTKEEAEAYVKKIRSEVDTERLKFYISYLRGEADDGNKEARDELNEFLPYSQRRTDDTWSREEVKSALRRMSLGTIAAQREGIRYALKINDICSCCRKMVNGENTVVVIDKNNEEYSLYRNSASQLIIETLFDL